MIPTDLTARIEAALEKVAHETHCAARVAVWGELNECDCSRPHRQAALVARAIEAAACAVAEEWPEEYAPPTDLSFADKAALRVLEGGEG